MEGWSLGLVVKRRYSQSGTRWTFYHVIVTKIRKINEKDAGVGPLKTYQKWRIM